MTATNIARSVPQSSLGEEITQDIAKHLTNLIFHGRKLCAHFKSVIYNNDCQSLLVSKFPLGNPERDIEESDTQVLVTLEGATMLLKHFWIFHQHGFHLSQTKFVELLKQLEKVKLYITKHMSFCENENQDSRIKFTDSLDLLAALSKTPGVSDKLFKAKWDDNPVPLSTLEPLQQQQQKKLTVYSFPYKLQKCTSMSELEKLITRDVLELKPSKQPGGGKISCPFCPGIFQQAKNMYNHVRKNCHVVKEKKESLSHPHEQSPVQEDLLLVTKVETFPATVPSPTPCVAIATGTQAHGSASPPVLASSGENENQIRSLFIRAKEVDIPAWLSELDPSWRPGKLLSNSAMQKLIQKPKYTSLYLTFAKENLGEAARHLVDKQFYDCFLTHDDEATIDNIRTKLQELNEQLLLAKEHEEIFQDFEHTFTDQELFTSSEVKKEMSAKVKQFISKQRARGKAEALSPHTVAKYTHALFSLQETSFLQYLTRTYDQSTHIAHLMFKKEGNITYLDSQLEAFIVGKNSGSRALGPASAENFVCAVLQLLEYLRISALRVPIR